MKVKILLYGENWSGTHIDCISTVLLQKNIDFKVFDFYKILSPYFFGNVLDKALSRILYKKNEKLINKLLSEEILSFRPNILLISKGVNIYPETLYKFKNSGILILNWNPDDFFNKYNSSAHLINSLEIYDYVFSARKHLFDEYISRGIKKPLYLEWYYIPWIHKSPQKINQIENKITFIGSYSNRREQLISLIRTKYKIEVWGAGWEYSKINKNRNISVAKKTLSQLDFTDIISKSKINLNILTQENRDLTNLKIFEITACGGLLLTEKNNSTKTILGDTAFFYDFENHQELNNTIEYIFDKENYDFVKEMQIMGNKTIVSNDHSINDRVEQILKIV